MKRNHGDGGLRLRGRIWWIPYRRNGKQIQESTKGKFDGVYNDGTSKEVALAMLNEKAAERQNEKIEECCEPKPLGSNNDYEGPKIIISPTRLKAFRKPCVYAFYSGEHCLYVGFGFNTARPLSHRHHRRQVLEHADRLVVYPCESKAAAQRLEARFIRELHPLFNWKRFENTGRPFSWAKFIEANLSQSKKMEQ